MFAKGLIRHDLKKLFLRKENREGKAAEYQITQKLGCQVLQSNESKFIAPKDLVQ